LLDARGGRAAAAARFLLSAMLVVLLGGCEADLPDYHEILVAEDTAAGDGFGSSVAISGDTLAVGAYREGDPVDRRGALYIGERAAGGGWNERTKLLVPGIGAGDQSGFSIAVDGDWLAAGAIGDFGKDATGNSRGRVDVYRRDGDDWTHHATLTRADAVDNDRYGFSVALADGVLVVGARGVDADAGAVYVHRLDGPDAAPMELRATESRPGDRFGEAVAFDGHTVLVGAPGRDGSEVDAGAVFVFTADEGRWQVAEAPLESPAPASEGRFGVGVGIDGDHAIIGASHWRAGGPPGQVWFTSRDAAGRWADPTAAVADDDSPPPSEPDDMEGFRVALSGTLAVAGAHLVDARGDNSGAVVAYVLGDHGWRRAARIVPTDGDADDHYGIALALDEGLVLVGAEEADAGGRESGGVYLIDPELRH